MNARMRLFSIGFLIFAFFSAGPAMAEYAGAERTFILFNGEAMDSTEHFSRWFEVKDAMRIIFRTWSTKSAFGLGTEVDSLFADSIQTFKTDFSDSVAFIAVDSLGVVVTARSTIPRTIGVHGEPYPMCADTIEFSGGFRDTAVTHTVSANLPINQILRAPATGSGRLGSIFNLVPGSASVCGDCTLQKRYMRVKITPLRRMTANTYGATGCAGACGTRVNGLKGLRMTATVIYRQH